MRWISRCRVTVGVCVEFSSVPGVFLSRMNYAGVNQTEVLSELLKITECLMKIVFNVFSSWDVLVQESGCNRLILKR